MSDKNNDHNLINESPAQARRTAPLAIGAVTPRSDAYEKVTGATKFAADLYGEGLVWAGVKRAGIPHGRIVRIDVEQALKVPGVLAALTHRDVKGTNRQGVVRRDQPVLANDEARHCGDPVALVLAEDRAALKKAIDLIRVDFEPLAPVLDMDEAMLPESPLVHEDHAGGNVLMAAELERGDIAAAEQACDAIVEADFETPAQEHAYLETEAGWARFEEDGKLVIACSTQTPFRDRMEVAEALGMNQEKIRVIAPYAGGAFGGKDGVTVQSLLALAAAHSRGRPVKMWWDREESFISGTKRHPARMRYRLGARKDGTLEFLKMTLHLDTGPYDHLGGVVLALGLEHAGGPYRIPNVSLKGWAVYTNNPIGGAFRGFGVTQVTAAMEQMMDILAERLSMDPMKLRLKNALRTGDRNPVGKTLTLSTGIVDCLEGLQRHSLWRDREAWKSEAPRFKRRGVGVAAVMQASGYGPLVPDYANAKVELTSEGKIRVYCGVVDMGQGNASTNLQIAGALLGQTMAAIELIQPDTDLSLRSCSASASRCTYTFGNALIGACETLRDRILQRAADLLMARSKDEVALIPNAVRSLTTDREIPLSAMAGLLNESERIATYHFRAPVAEEVLTDDQNFRMHGLPHTLFSYGAALAMVEMDELTGFTDLKRLVIFSDCGSVLNPQIYEQQIQGGAAQGIGFALYEELGVSEGRVTSQNFSSYLIPTSMDVPEVDSFPVGIVERTGPFGLKGVGEIATTGPLPAVANAIADACAARVFRSPITAERALKALRAQTGCEALS